jgi:hypothetical protein
VLKNDSKKERFTFEYWKVINFPSVPNKDAVFSKMRVEIVLGKLVKGNPDTI